MLEAFSQVAFPSGNTLEFGDREKSHASNL
jgi:hypothetical protein